jgi:threonine dehydratase
MSTQNITRSFSQEDVIPEVLGAEERIRDYIRETPLERNELLSRMSGADVYLKLENQQVSGSFKFRGALNKLLAASDKELAKGVVTSSTGNHGAAFAYASTLLEVEGTVFVPENVSPAKLEAMKLAGAHIQFHGLDTERTETHARAVAQEEGKLFISPYNDPRIIGGQGTIGLEILRQAEDIDGVLIPVGGGGLAAGIAGYSKSQNPAIQIYGCQPEHSPVMAESVKAGHIVRMESLPTLADGTAGGIEQGSITFPVCRRCVDGFFLVSEEEIAAVIRLFLEKFQLLIEGAAALPVAALLKEGRRFEGKKLALIISGKKISLDTIKKIIC